MKKKSRTNYRPPTEKLHCDCTNCPNGKVLIRNCPCRKCRGCKIHLGNRHEFDNYKNGYCIDCSLKKKSEGDQIINELGFKRMAMRVLIVAGQDWDIVDPDTKQFRYRGQIKNWILRSDFEEWCDAAGMDVKTVRRKFGMEGKTR